MEVGTGKQSGNCETTNAGWVCKRRLQSQTPNAKAKAKAKATAKAKAKAKAEAKAKAKANMACQRHQPNQSQRPIVLASSDRKSHRGKT